jgi:hypothetical protein
LRKGALSSAFYAMGPGLPRASGSSSTLPDRPGLGVELDLSMHSA